MATHNANYEIVSITSGTYTLAQLGDGISASTVHEIFCLTPGSITIGAIGGGSATFALTTGQSVRVLCSTCSVLSGTYAGFRSKFQYGGIAPNQYGGNL